MDVSGFGKHGQQSSKGFLLVERLQEAAIWSLKGLHLHHISQSAGIASQNPRDISILNNKGLQTPKSHPKTTTCFSIFLLQTKTKQQKTTKHTSHRISSSPPLVFFVCVSSLVTDFWRSSGVSLGATASRRPSLKSLEGGCRSAAEEGTPKERPKRFEIYLTKTKFAKKKHQKGLNR